MHFSLLLADRDGCVIDPLAVGVEGLVELMRDRPRVAPDGVVDTGALQADGPAQVLAAVDRLLARVHALRVAAVAAVGEALPVTELDGAVTAEIMAALRVSRRSADFTRGEAESLRDHPSVWAALCAGRLDVARARLLSQKIDEIPRSDDNGIPRDAYETDCARIQDAGLAYAAEHTAAQLRRFLDRLLAALDPGAVGRRRRAAISKRGLWMTDRRDGTADMHAILAAEDAAAVWSAVRAKAIADARCGRAAAETSSGSNGTGDSSSSGSGGAGPLDAVPFDARMADALRDLILPPDGSGQVQVATEIHVTIPVTSLAGLSEEPASAEGFWALPAEVARRLAAGDSRWRYVLTAPDTGSVLDVGRASYRPPPFLSRFVRLRDGSCRFPGCAVPAKDCDLDHLIPFPVGATAAANLHCLCRSHHRLKHEGDWSLEALGDGRLRWTSPLGSVVHSEPAVLGPPRVDTAPGQTTAAA